MSKCSADVDCGRGTFCHPPTGTCKKYKSKEGQDHFKTNKHQDSLPKRTRRRKKSTKKKTNVAPPEKIINSTRPEAKTGQAAAATEQSPATKKASRTRPKKTNNVSKREPSGYGIGWAADKVKATGTATKAILSATGTVAKAAWGVTGGAATTAVGTVAKHALDSSKAAYEARRERLRREGVRRDREAAANEHREHVNAAKREHEKAAPWEKQPGTVGFNQFARAKIADTIINARYECTEDRNAQPHQLILKALTVPHSSIKRIGVSWPTGTGKTRGMLDVLDNWFALDNGKVAIFPNNSIRNNFVEELMKSPGKWRDFVQRQAATRRVSLRDRDGKLDMSTENRRFIEDTIALKGKLSKSGVAGFPGGPLRFFTYSQAGGYPAFGANPNPVFKRPKKTKNPYDNCDVILDEVHALTRPVKKEDMDRIAKLKDALYKSKNMRLVAVSATWFETRVEEYEDIMRVVKGTANQDSKTDEGFLVHLPVYPADVFASTLPANPRTTLASVIHVELTGDTLAKYTKKRKEFAKTQRDSTVKLSRYCNNSLYYAGQSAAALAKAGEISYSSKFDAIVKYVRANPDKKRLLMIHRQAGLKTLVETLRQRLQMPFAGTTQCVGDVVCLSHILESSDEAELIRNRFNEADRGLIVADRKEFSTGVSFLGVTELILVDVPESITEYVQVLGRPLRMCGHASLPTGKRVLNIVMFCAKIPGDVETAEGILLKKIETGLDTQAIILAKMKQVAIDSELYDKYVDGPTGSSTIGGATRWFSSWLS